MGAEVNIVTMPGYLPMINNLPMLDLFKSNAAQLVGEGNIASHPATRNRGSSTDMGDLSQIMPVIHPYTTAATGTGHSPDYIIEDYVQAVLNPAKAMAMTVIDLLTGNAEKAKTILDTCPPAMSKQQYLQLQDARLTEEHYVGQ
jgi:metal-dependent amidase/aminoacylase/carboxypeptidase family protein